jgi:transitional endoplasmic reticulum ATPase
MIADHKKKAIESEYGDILDIRQPVGGWNLLGNHELLIQWANRFVVMPMRLGDRRNMTRGGMILGPPGTGKTWFAECLAGECGVNFVLVDFSKLFGGVVGETEKNVDRLYDAIEAMAPCVVCMDEIDSAGLSRQSTGDSGVTARVFNRTMQWLSDDARWGKVVVLAISNRPDMLDAAFMRPGRFDQIIAALPPGPKNAKGRVNILNALSKKANIVFDVSLKNTLKTADKGIGRLLYDSRLWTGAEMEGLLKRAFSNAVVRKTDAAIEDSKAKKLPARDMLDYIRQSTKSVLVDITDWNKAFDSYRPSTRDMARMIHLALEHTNDRDYLPEEWQGQYDQIRSEATGSTATFDATPVSLDRE